LAPVVRLDFMGSGIFLRLLSLAMLFCFLLPSGVAQRVIVNSNGDRIIMYPDGSWRKVEPGDSVLLRQNLQKSETIGIPSDKIDPTEKRTPAEGEEYTLRQWNELHFKIKEQVNKVLHDFRVATNAQFKAGELLQNAKANKNLIESDRLATLHEDYGKSIRNLRTAKLNQKAISKIANESKKLAGLPPKKIEKKLPQLRSKFESYVITYEPGHSVPTQSKPVVPKKEIVKNTPSSKNAKPQHSAKTKDRGSSAKTVNVRLPPQQISKPYKSEPFHCKVITDTVDEATGRRRILLESGLIFTHTDPDLRPYFKSKELITCYGRLSKIDAYIYLYIDFQIAISHSQGNFGSLETGSLLRLRLLNGKYVSLYNLTSDRGQIDPYSGHTIFTGQYALGKDEIKMLSSSTLDKIRILWSTGYEDYDVYKIDFFIHQINCLQAK